MAVVLEEILGSATVQEISEPAGIRCSPALATRRGEHKDEKAERRAREVFIIQILQFFRLWQEPWIFTEFGAPMRRTTE